MLNIFKRKTDNQQQGQQEAEPQAEAETPDDRSWFDRLKGGLTKTRHNLMSQMSSLLKVGRKIDAQLLDELEEILIQADVGVNTTLKLIDQLKRLVKDQGLEDSSQLKSALQEEILKIFGDEEDLAIPVDLHKPFSIMVLGVNGVGKTTTIGKLAAKYQSEGKRVIVAAGDTFRAAAADQLDIWCHRAGVELVKHQDGSDPAAVVFDAIQAAKARKSDLIIADTAGRLHTKKNLMAELSKISRVISRELPSAPHEVLLVLDATTGQNAIMQAKIFNETVKVTGIVLTKLDGTAKGGIVIAIKDELDIPVKMIGIGEKIDDLRPFNPKDFVRALFEDDEADVSK